jgi:hypothetical protein
MTKFTVVIGTQERAEKIERKENALDAIISAWENKMQGKEVKVVSDTCETIYR